MEQPDTFKVLADAIVAELLATVDRAWQWALANPLPSLGVLALILVGAWASARPRRRRV